MRQLFILLILMPLALVSCNSQSIEPSSINGISFVATRDSINNQDVSKLKPWHASHMAIIPYGFMPAVDKPQLIYDSENQWYGESVPGVKQAINLFQEQDFKIMLKPQIWIGRGVYTGTINYTNENDWLAFEKNYSAYILKFAQVAQDNKVNLLCIGTELDGFVNARPQYWMELIKKIRAIYDGQLTYAGNWDSYKRVPFWSQIDYIGVDAYFPLSDEKTPTAAVIKESWKKWTLEMSTLSRKHNKKILLTEYGYISADYAGREPWKSATDSQEINEPAQAVLLTGLYEALWDETWMAGGFLWKYHAEESRYRGYLKRFTPQYKLGQDVVSRYYGNL